MTNLSNLQRDQLHGDLPGAFRGSLSGNSATIGQSISCNALAGVNQQFGQLYLVDSSFNHAPGQWAGAGVFLQQPVEEAEPYRFKVYVGTSESAEVFGFVGVAPENPVTGNNDITDVIAFPIPDGKLDEVVLLMPPAVQNPLCFGVAVGEGQGDVVAFISVQRLSKVPPPYSSAVS